MARNKKTRNEGGEGFISSLERGMLNKTDFNDEELESYLTQGEVRASEKPEVPPQILWVDDCTIATFGNFSASTGKAKSKKTFNLTAIAAAAVNNSTVLNYRASLPEGKRTILYFDTEQSRYHCHTVIERIYKLAGLSLKKEDKRIRLFGLREFTPALRIALIDYALRKFDGIGLVIIDGLRDLMYDINNAKESTDIMTMLMAWTSKYNLHIHCVLHLNKSDDNVRGHIGTELNNKAETVLVIAKSQTLANASEVKPLSLRDREFEPFAFKIDEEGMPVDIYDYEFGKKDGKASKMTIGDITEEQHEKALAIAFHDKVVSGYEHVLTALSKGYGEIGFARGRTTLSKLLTYLLTNKKVVKSASNEYCLPKNYPSLPLIDEDT